VKRHRRHRLWTAGVVILALSSFLAGTSLACLQKGIGNIRMAENCCQGHCQHVMVGDMAAKCCQSHQTKVPQVLRVAPSAKAIFLVASILPGSLIPPAVLQDPEQFWVRLSTGERSPPSPPFYTLHCALLI
jgi:hypothetical protein